jgi:hypothetical protein
MSDNPAKRVPRTFEPPPWERDAFEELARKREVEEAAAREAEEAAAQLRAAEALKTQAAAAAKKGDEGPVVAAARALAEEELAKEQGGAAAVTVGDGGTGGQPAETPEAATPEIAVSTLEQSDTGPGAPKVDDRKVAEMLAVLSTQEPKAKGGGVLALVVGIAFVILGVAMIVVSVWWQAVGQQQSGTTASTLLFQVLLVGGFGLGFAIVGGLIVYLGRQQARS